MIIGLVLLLEVLVPFSINYSVIVICVILFFINLADTKKLLDLGDERDKAEKLAKQHKD